VIPQVARAHAPIRISLQSKEISREVCHEKATPPIARRKNPIEIELSPTEDSGTSSSQAWVPPQPKNRRRIEIVEPSTEKALSTQSLGPSRRSPKIVRRKQPPEPKEATIAPVIVPTPRFLHFSTSTLVGLTIKFGLLYLNSPFRTLYRRFFRTSSVIYRE